MSSNRHPIEQEELMAYLDGELSADEATEALSHLEQCPSAQSPRCGFPKCFPRIIGLGS